MEAGRYERIKYEEIETVLIVQTYKTIWKLIE